MLNDARFDDLDDFGTFYREKIAPALRADPDVDTIGRRPGDLPRTMTDATSDMEPRPPISDPMPAERIKHTD